MYHLNKEKDTCVTSKKILIMFSFRKVKMKTRNFMKKKRKMKKKRRMRRRRRIQRRSRTSWTLTIDCFCDRLSHYSTVETLLLVHCIIYYVKPVAYN